MTFGHNESTVRSKRSELLSKNPKLDMVQPPRKRNQSNLLEIFPDAAEEEDKEVEDHKSPPDKTINDTSSFRFSSRKNTSAEEPQQESERVMERARTPTTTS